MRNERNIGIVRHMDDLGRIVVPKEVRKQLGIEAEDAVEISVSGRTIHMRKYQPLQTLETLCRAYLDAFWKSCKAVCLVCSTEKVIATRGMELSTELLLSDEVRNYIKNQKEYQFAETFQISLFENSRYLVDSIYPVGMAGNPMGAVILIHFRDATPVERGCAKYLADILSELIKQNEV